MPGTSQGSESLEALFRRWRDAEDSEALAEVLARSEDELLVIARRQVRDESAAWDLVQETWHTVLRDARRWDADQRLMPWLVGILQIEARRARRAATRVPDPERVSTPIVPAADAHLPEAEVREHVTGALERLPTMYREVLSMHLFEDLTHREIAERTGREAATVRVQVFRGLAQLRKLIPASLSLGTALAILAPRSEAARLAPIFDGVARMGSGAAASGASAGAAAKTGEALTSGTAGGLLTGAGSAWLLGAAAAALVTAVAWYATRDDAPNSSTDRAVAVVGPEASSARDVASSGPDRGLVDVPSSGRTGLAATSVGASALASGVRLVARVVGLEALSSGAPTLTLRANAQAPRVARLDAVANFEVDLTDWYAPTGLAPREFIAEYDHPNGLPARVPILVDADALLRARAAAETGKRKEFAVTFAVLPPAARVHGRAAWNEDVGGNTSFGRLATLFTFDESGELAADPVEGIEVRADGTFSLRAARTGRHVVVVAALGGQFRPETIAVDLVAGEDRDLGRIALGAGSSITGVVHTDPNGVRVGLEPVVRWSPVDGLRVLSVYGTPLAWTGRRFERAGGEVAAASDGRFEIRGLGTGAIEFAHGYASDAKRPLIEFPSGPESVVRIVPPFAGLVLEPAGPIARVTVRAQGELVESAGVWFLPSRGDMRASFTDARGFVALVGAHDGTLRVLQHGYETLERSFVGPVEGLIEVDLVKSVPPGNIVLDALGVEWKDAVVRLIPGASVGDAVREALRRGEIPTTVRDALSVTAREFGVLTEPVPAGHWWIHVSANRDAVDGAIAHARPFVAELDVTSGITTRVDVALDLAGRIRFASVAARPGALGVALELTDSVGERVALPVTSLVQRGDARQGRLKTTDRFAFGANATSGLLEPGTYVLRATIGAETRTKSIAIEAGRTTVIDLEAQSL